jgi:lipopolysaccharide transport system permease protein
MAGVTAWTYFAECLNRTSTTFIQNASVFGKVYFPRLTVPISMVISNLIKFAIQFALFLGFIAYFRLRGAAVHPNWAVLVTPGLLLLMAALGLGVGIIVSALTTKYRDLQVLVTFGVQLAMYATPIIYPLSMFPNSFRWMIIVNPMAPIIEAFRYGFLGEGLFSWGYLGISAGIIGAILFLGILLFNHVERTFMDTV